MTVGVLAGVKDDGFLQTRAEALFKQAEPAQVFAADAGAGLDLEGGYLTVVALKHKVHLIARLSAEVADCHRSV